jgi:hypothetical protein
MKRFNLLSHHPSSKPNTNADLKTSGLVASHNTSLPPLTVCQLSELDIFIGVFWDLRFEELADILQRYG